MTEDGSGPTQRPIRFGLTPGLENRPSNRERGGFTVAEYVDGFVVPVPKDNVDEYRRIASAAGALWREHGALD